MRPVDPIGVVETAYRLGDDEPAWLAGLASAIAPALDDRLGLAAFSFDATDPAAFRWGTPAFAGASDAIRQAVVVALGALGPALVGTLFAPGGALVSASDLTGLGAAFVDFPPAWAFGHPHGAVDLLAVKVADPSARGIVFVAGRREVTAPSGPAVEEWARIAAHVASAWRLRRGLAGGAVLEGADAVLAPDGRCLDATGDARPTNARDALREAVLRMEQARGALRSSDPASALQLWRGLVSGRWSLVEHFDHDGRRFLVARRNPPEVVDPRALTFRERQVAGHTALGHPNQVVAYTLGLSPATVSTHLAKAMRKLGVRTRADLVRTYGPLARATLAPPSDSND